MRNTLSDLNNILFAELENLQDEGLTEEEFQQRLRRADKVALISESIVRNAELEFKVMAHMNEYGYGASNKSGLVPVPAMLGCKE